MGFAVFNIFFFLTGGIMINLLQVTRIHMDAFSLCFILLNFSVSDSAVRAVNLIGKGNVYMPTDNYGNYAHNICVMTYM